MYNIIYYLLVYFKNFQMAEFHFLGKYMDTNDNKKHAIQINQDTTRHDNGHKICQLSLGRAHCIRKKKDKSLRILCEACELADINNTDMVITSTTPSTDWESGLTSVQHCTNVSDVGTMLYRCWG